jgi:hypothetical protein
MTAYSIYLLLPSKSGGCILHPQAEDTPHHGDKPHNMANGKLKTRNTLLLTFNIYIYYYQKNKTFGRFVHTD